MNNKVQERIIESLSNIYPTKSFSGDLLLTGFNVKYLSFVADILGRYINKRIEISVYETFEDYNEESFESNIVVGKSFDIGQLQALGYSRAKRVWEEGEYSMLGDVIIIHPHGGSYVLRVSFNEDIVEKIVLVDKKTRYKVKEVSQYTISSIDQEKKQFCVYGNELADDMYKYRIIYIGNTSSLSGYKTISLDIKQIPGVTHASHIVLERVLREYSRKNYEVIFSVYDKKKVGKTIKTLGIEKFSIYENLKENGIRGFVWDSIKTVLISDVELSGEVELNIGGDVKSEDDIYKRIIPGDYVVHEDHGIGLFSKVVSKEGIDYLEVKYAKKDRLLIPFSQVNKITKFIGSGKKSPRLTGLDSGIWMRVKKKVKEDVLKLAKELLQIYAMRSVLKGEKIIETEEHFSDINDFIDRFEYMDTEDQTVVTGEIVKDLSSGLPMDRLVVGDVGFGKTEIAMRTAFATVNSGYQVAILAPTTILVQQHLAVLKERFKDYPFRIEGLSRFLNAKGKDEVIDNLENGNIDIIVGTHSLLSDSILFKNLGLLVIDEEQKFGVKQKEKLKSKRLKTNILSMTATPIPRTLNMAISGIRDMSILASAPEGRKSVENVVKKFSYNLASEVIKEEIERDGQVYYLHNRVSDIYIVQEKLVKLLGEDINISVAHGQMTPQKLSKVMNEFSNGMIDVLICTTIIENGLDIPNVNTLIVDNASMYGLSQLYQIRGRIGRGSVQAYAYFLYDTLLGDASLRLDALIEAGGLGSGFILSSRDLEIRGAGNILGKSQSGSIDSIGYGFYSKLLSEAVSKLKNATQV